MSAATSAKSTKASFQPESDVHISYEDQQKINQFARLNAQFVDFGEELKEKQVYLKNLEDACDELELLEGDIEKVPYFMGEAFITQDFQETQKSLEEAKELVKSQISDIEKKSAEIKEAMTDLKTKLYAQFGSNINLEPEDE